MQRSTVLTAFQRAAALFLAASMVPAGWAQDASSVPSAPSAQMPTQQAVPSSSQPFDVKEYSKPRSHFPNLIAPVHSAARSAAEPGQHAAHRPTHARRQTLHLDERRGRAGARKQPRYRHRPLQPEHRRYRHMACQSRFQHHSRRQQRCRAEHARRRRRRTRHTSWFGPGRNLGRSRRRRRRDRAAWFSQPSAVARLSPASIPFLRARFNSTILESIALQPFCGPHQNTTHWQFRLHTRDSSGARICRSGSTTPA